MTTQRDIDTLLAAAAKAPRPTRRPQHAARWARLWPVVTTLRGRGYTYDQAISWLVDNGAMTEAERPRARNAFWQMQHRRNRRSADEPEVQTVTDRP